MIDVTKLRGFSDKVIVEVFPDEHVSPAGLLLDHANIEREKVLRGRVLSPGDGPVSQRGVRLPTELKTGDIILFPRHRGWPIETAELTTNECTGAATWRELVALREDPEWILGVEYEEQQ